MTDHPVGEGVARLDRAVRAAAVLVSGVADGQWSEPTACEDMDVHGLVEHMVAGLEQFCDVGLGKPFDADTYESIVDRSLPGAYVLAGESIVSAWSAPGVVDQVYEMPWGPTPGAALVDFMTIEEIAHGWDLARATGQACPFDDDLIQAALELAEQYDDETIRVPGMFGPAIDVDDDATPFDRLAGFLGRQP